MTSTSFKWFEWLQQSQCHSDSRQSCDEQVDIIRLMTLDVDRTTTLPELGIAFETTTVQQSNNQDEVEDLESIQVCQWDVVPHKVTPEVMYHILDALDESERVSCWRRLAFVIVLDAADIETMESTWNQSIEWFHQLTSWFEQHLTENEIQSKRDESWFPLQWS